MPKSTENTVFVRFHPTPRSKVMRHQLEDIFSQVGPIKKSSWISSQDSSKGYGFVKYVTQQDAEASANTLNNHKIEMEGEPYQIKVELASFHLRENPEARNKRMAPQTHTDQTDLTTLKKQARIIVRNLSFYAKESHVRKAMQKQFGPIVEVHIPTVRSATHVGFGFVTFENPKHAQEAVESKSIEICKRKASMEWCIPKSAHREKKQLSNKAPEKGLSDTRHNKKEDEEEDSDEASLASEDSNEDEDEGNEEEKRDEMDENAVAEKRTLFLRNLPFDTTRHDIFHLFARFGHIKSIYLVRNKTTGMLKGTGFLSYSESLSAEKALQHTSTQSRNEDNESGPKKTDEDTNHDLVLRGRRILVDIAVDKNAASTFDLKASTSPTDRRNIYLQTEARVESTDASARTNDLNSWDFLPEQDQKKRQWALKEKTTKLQSPLFFINPMRLSFRNLAKHIDEATLLEICREGTEKGMENGLVKVDDQIAHWRAQGSFTSREIVTKIQEESSDSILPPIPEGSRNKEYFPSVFIERDFSRGASKSAAPSRGYGFAEFKHHVHALACLRELNNNPSYSKRFVAGGKAVGPRSKGGKTKQRESTLRVPRLIVDFAVSTLCPWVAYHTPILTTS